MRLWRPSDVFRDGDVLEGYWLRRGEVYKTLTYTDQPTIRIQNVVTGKTEVHVISSPLFAEFSMLEPKALGTRGHLGHQRHHGLRANQGMSGAQAQTTIRTEAA